MKNISLPNALDVLNANRTGGSFTIRGIDYQFLYTVTRLLTEFNSLKGENTMFQLEGVEDLDFYRLNATGLENEHIQVKCKNTFDSDDFVKDILNNLLEVYDTNPNSCFTIISNVHPKGKLEKWATANRNSTVLPKNTQEYWSTHIKTLRENYSDNQIQDFLKRVQFFRKTHIQLYQDAMHYLIDSYGITNGNEAPFFQSLYYAISQCSLRKQ